MMGSFWKLLLVVAVVAIAWFGWRWFQRWEKERREIADRRGAADAVRRQRGKADEVQVEELVKCRACGAFVAASARACGKPGCPLPR
jgi:membrane protein implicated in regulation of membrane protease activity